MKFYDFVLLCMTRLCMTMYDYVWLCMAMYNYLWLCLTMYNYVWLCTTIVTTPTQLQPKPNSVGLDMKMGLIHRISSGCSPYKLRLLHTNSKFRSRKEQNTALLFDVIIHFKMKMEANSFFVLSLGCSTESIQG